MLAKSKIKYIAEFFENLESFKIGSLEKMSKNQVATWKANTNENGARNIVDMVFEAFQDWLAWEDDMKLIWFWF